MPNSRHNHDINLFKRVVAPLPFLTLEGVKEWLEISDIDRDTMITSAMKAACLAIEGYDGLIGKAVMTQQWSVSYSRLSGCGRAYLPVTPAASIVSITYFLNGVETSLTVSDFTLYENEDIAYLRPNEGGTWPGGYDDREDAFTIVYVAGFGDIDDVPQDIKVAGKQLTASYFENREGVSDLRLAPVPFGMQTIIDKYRVGWVA